MDDIRQILGDDARNILGPEHADRINAIEAAATKAAKRQPPRPAPKCEECKDAYWLPLIGTKMSECPACWGRHEAGQNARAQQTAGISQSHRAYSLDDYRPTTRHSEEALATARQYVERWEEAKKRGKGLYFYGPPGVGKTHLAYGVANTLIRRDRSRTVLCVREVDLFAELSARYGPDPGRAAKGEHLYRRARDAELLLVDDLGAAKSTESREEARYVILDERLNEYRPTIITSNHYPDHLSSVIGERMVSRLHGMSFVLPVTGPDHRRPAARSSR